MEKRSIAPPFDNIGLMRSTFTGRGWGGLSAFPPLDPLPCQFYLINLNYPGRGKYYFIAISSARNVEFLRNSPFVISHGGVYKSLKIRDDFLRRGYQGGAAEMDLFRSRRSKNAVPR
jgi:hypothetical protein